MTVTYYTAVTLDGFLADENDSLDWLFHQEQDPNGPMNYAQFIDGVGAIVMGATTYQWLLDHDDNWPYEMPAWIVTHRAFPSTDHDIRFVQGDVATLWPDVAASAGEKDVWIVGGGDLAAQFAEAGHLDRMIVYIAPVTLGAGRPLFPRRFDFELVDVARNGNFVCAEYATTSRM
ncbi:dihydrofolate reductase [Rhodococcoides trifolii]|uniref:Dihydrofolate reductase n=1 Tax=Rhodococcoides trifolii TaxID=908250 RepID=A0A917G392_9NOCA|nr:dihydrofolate reductase family protein [Rhodococcus trifolii]GGG20959.1 dihydrofolate reductase [Rhodococcus trifolii]